MSIEIIEKERELFLEKLKKEGYAEATISAKNKHISVFFDFLCKNDMDNFPPSDLKKKDLIKFGKFLKKKGLKETTKKSYLSTVSTFLFHIGVPAFSKKEEETDIQKIVNYYFETKGYSIDALLNDIKKKKIIYSRYTKPAKDLLHLTGSVNKAKKAIDKVAVWAKSRNLDYAIETVFKKWLEIDNLKPKKKKKKAYYRNDPMIWSETKQKWFVIVKNGDWLEFAGKENEIEWREE